MLKLKLFSVLSMVLMLAFAANISAQDAPNSVGPAPKVYNIGPTSEVFVDANPNSRQIFCISTSTSAGQKSKGLLSGCTGTTLGAPITYFPGAYTRVTPNQYYIIDQIGLRLLRMDSLGNEVLLGNVTGSPQANLTGMTWNAATGQMFVISTSITVSQIGRLDTTTRVITPIGSPSAVCAGAITASIAPQGGSLFAVDIVADNLYKCNLTTGVFTLVGPLGQNANFGQDAQFDYDGILYWAAYTTGPQLRTIDTTTGGGALICAYVGTQATAMATIPAVPPPPPAANFCRNGINIVIPDLSVCRDSMMVILGNGCNITDVNVRIDTVVHTFDADMIFYLRRVVGNVGSKIINRVGGGGDNFINTVLDDEGTTPIASGVAPFTGTFIPSSPLTPFDGLFTAGFWSLTIQDTVGGDSGWLRAWCINITYTSCVGGIQTIEVPNYYSLSQNYPNPFNPSTTIKFGMPKSENVKLIIYDMLGREVRTLVNEIRNPGTYEISFDASELSSGVYFYRLETPSFAETKKMLLVK